MYDDDEDADESDDEGGTMPISFISGRTSAIEGAGEAEVDEDVVVDALLADGEQ